MVIFFLSCCHFFPLTFQQHRHQGCTVAVLSLLHQQLAVIQDVSDGVAPLDDAVHDVTGVVLLVGAECLEDHRAMLRPAAVAHGLTSCTLGIRTGLMSLLRDPMKSALVTCSFSARSMSTSTVDVACWRVGGQQSSSHGFAYNLSDELVSPFLWHATWERMQKRVQNLQ